MTLTRKTAKCHCRTCLIKLNINNIENPSLSSATTLQPEFFFHINSIRSELNSLMTRWFPNEGIRSEEYPEHLCVNCYNQLLSFDRFRKLAEESATKLAALFDIKLETDGEDHLDDLPRQLSTNSQNELLTDVLMEPETVILRNSDSDLRLQDFLNTEQLQGESPDALHEVDVEASIADKKKASESKAGKRTTRASNRLKTKESLHEALSEEEKDKHHDIHISMDICSGLEDHLDGSDSNLPKNESEANSSVCRLKKKTSKRKPRTRLKTGSASDAKALVSEDLKDIDSCASTRKTGSIRRHRQKGSKNVFKCLQCNHAFASKITLDAHVRKVHEGSKRPFQCERCDKSYSFIGGLYTHIKEIHEAPVRSYPCDFGNGCDRIYTSMVSMLKHKRTKHMSTGECKKFICEQCGATFNQSSNLRMHRQTKHATASESEKLIKEKPHFECQICQKNFHSQYTLKYHTLQLHSKDKKFECNVCGRRLAKKFMLVQHMLVHSTEKTPCELCGKQFVRKFELNAHIKAVHMKLKPYECSHCSESFASKKTLRHHEYIHTGEKPYVCTSCGQAFRQQTCLKTHKKIHEKAEMEFMLLQALPPESKPSVAREEST